jgi:hypothetical protein
VKMTEAHYMGTHADSIMKLEEGENRNIMEG